MLNKNDSSPATSTASNRSNRSSRLLIGAGLATLVALSGAAFGVYQWREQQRVESRANWENVQVQALTGHTNELWSVALSPDGETLATASEDRTIRLWNAETGS